MFENRRGPHDQRPPERELPHNLDAEQEFLGACLCNNEAMFAGEYLKPEHFWHEAHRRIFATMHAIVAKGQVANPVTLQPYLSTDAVVRGAGGTAYLARLARSATTVINASDYAKAIYDCALRRDLIAISEKLIAAASAPDVGEAAGDIVAKAEASLIEAANGAEAAILPSTSVRDGVTAFYERLKAIKDGKGLGINTGLAPVDKIVSGLAPGDLCILAGRPGMGKSAFAVELAVNIAKAYGESHGTVLFFSLEMSAEQLMSRILARESRIPYQRMFRGDISNDELSKDIGIAGYEVSKLRIQIIDRGKLSTMDMRSAARRQQRKTGLSLIVVDYLQLAKAGAAYRGQKVNEVGEITGDLKAMAKDLGVPVIALSQLSRAVEQRPDKRPQLSDLRESGAIEQDADHVWFAFREAYYHELAEPDAASPEHSAWAVKLVRIQRNAEILVAKQRQGPTGVALLECSLATNRFWERPGYGAHHG